MRTFICCSHKVETLLLLGLSKIQMMALHWHKFRTENFKLVWLLLHQRVSVRVFNYNSAGEKQGTSGCGLRTTACRGRTPAG